MHAMQLQLPRQFRRAMDFAREMLCVYKLMSRMVSRFNFIESSDYMLGTLRKTARTQRRKSYPGLTQTLLTPSQENNKTLPV